MRTLLAPLLVLALAAPARADEDESPSRGDSPRAVDKGTLGVGLMVGEPVGVCARLYLQDDQAIQGAIGAAFIGGGFQVHADYVIHPYIIQTRDSFVLATYVGPGVRVFDHRGGNAGDYVALGLRGVGGLLFDFKNPLDAFVEVAGIAEYGFQDDVGFGLAINVAVGVRYYF
jgi:hypothetical protein